MQKFLLAVMLFSACVGEGATELQGDARCVSLCQIDEPELDGAYDICSVASAQSCVAQCESRIGTTETVCASCLLDGASFDTGPTDESANCGPSGTCTVTGRGGSCTYDSSNTSDRDRCLRQVFPRREVSCSPRFQDARNCGGVCN